MSIKKGVLQRHAKHLVALVLIVGLYWFALPPDLSAAQRAQLASHFHFTHLTLPTLPGQPLQFVRTVHPSLEGISAWISAWGASVALNDLDGDGLPNDVCYVDTRTNQVIVAAVPGTPARYEPFALDPAPLSYDPATTAPTGCLSGDFNEDGLADILVYYWGRTPLVFLHRPIAVPGRLSNASYVPRELVPGGGRWYTNSVTRADLDGDGHIDLVISNYYPDGAHVLDASGTGVEQMPDSWSRAYNGGNKRLLLWRGATAGPEPTVHFEEVRGVLDSQTNHSWGNAVAACDLNGDLLPELYFANDFGPDRLLYNRSTPGHLRFTLLEGVETLTTPPSKVLGLDSFKGMGVDCADLNGDGLPDLVVSNITSQYSFEESNFVFLSTGELNRMQDGGAPYVESCESLGLCRSGWSWDVKIADFDNMGALQIVQAVGFVQGDVNRWPEMQELGTGNEALVNDPRNYPTIQPGADVSGHEHNPFYVRAPDGRYYNIAPEVGFFEPQVSRGIAVADVDGDGRLDCAVANMWGVSTFYHNESPNAGGFLGLHLLQPLHPEAMRIRPGHPGADTRGWAAIGATATVYLPGGRRLAAQVDGGNGFSGRGSSDLHFGLGYLPGGTQLRVDLHWRDPGGRLHFQTVYLSQGYSTILLGW
jgi:enediyne biosynthesis protein E4